MIDLRRNRRILSVALVYGLTLLLLAIVAPRYFRPENLRAALVGNAHVLVAAVGMTLVILCRHIDISIGSQMCVCGVLAGLMARAGLPLPIVVAGTLSAGALFGAINGALIAGLRMPSIVVTLATMVVLRESLRFAREGEFVRNLPPGFQWFGAGAAVGPWIIVGIALAVFLAAAWIVRNVSVGRAVLATGSDPEAARLAGFRPQRIVFGVFAVMGALAGLAAFLNAVRFADVDPNAGAGLELQTIAAVVVGGTAITGGRGSLWGTLLGVVLLATIAGALVFVKIPAQWEKAIQGVVILLAVASDAFERSER